MTIELHAHVQFVVRASLQSYPDAHPGYRADSIKEMYNVKRLPVFQVSLSCTSFCRHVHKITNPLKPDYTCYTCTSLEGLYYMSLLQYIGSDAFRCHTMTEKS